ncbi:AsnC family transcriptional regulator [Pilimelia terevasa]|uniref:AsnC family transcriptional regulator n=1 Tax=Pilimelia terevasa TaxID=53372 RepID=A0A8J3BKN7_9ACTN|nr:Lrp/AsnC ligand binding domain-containing protein [Pilimelia terevasa]GGK28403.1 AsnC family transcriptional regulator [Pilimelia terevasa]
MVQAYILIQSEIGTTGDAVEWIAKIPGVVRVDAVTGPYDIVVLGEAPDLDHLGRMVVGQVQAVAGVTRTTTCTVVNL